MSKLDSRVLHLLRLSVIGQAKSTDGWAKVSKSVWPILDFVPEELLERRATDDGGFCRVTHDGEVILEFS